MTAYRLRNATVEAFQWAPGVTGLPGVAVVITTLHFSADGAFCYITYADEIPRYWMQVQAVDGPVPAASREDILKAWLQVTQGTVYHREMLPFRFWELRKGLTRPLDPEADKALFDDYAQQHAWKPGRIVARADVAGGVANVAAGDWILRQPDGALSVMKPELFAATYEAVNG